MDNGGEDKFETDLAKSLSIDKSRVKVVTLTEGSVIVDYKIEFTSGSGDDKKLIENFQDKILENGLIDLGGPISSYGSKSGPKITPATYIEPVVLSIDNINIEKLLPEQKSGNGAAIAVSVILSLGFTGGLAAFAYKHYKKD